MSLVELEDSGCTSTCGDKGIRGKMGNCSDSDSTSSIGKNSDATGGEEDSGESSGEVESPYKGGGGGGGLDAMEALEEVLPIRRGISRFYNGKSKSFASLARASSIQDLAKSENAFTRRRRNLLASSLIWDKNRFGSSSPLRSNGGGISKKTLTNLSRTNLALAVAMTATSSTPSNTTTTTTTTTTSCLELESDMNLVSPTLLPLRKPKPLMSDLSLMHRDISTWRSFSLADLQRAGATTSIETPTTPHSALAFTTSDEPMPFLAKLT